MENNLTIAEGMIRVAEIQAQSTSDIVTAVVVVLDIGLFLFTA